MECGSHYKFSAPPCIYFGKLPKCVWSNKNFRKQIYGLRRYCTAHYFLMCPIMDCIPAIPRMLSPWLSWHHSQSALECFNYKHQSFQEWRLQNCSIKQLCWAGHVSRLEDLWLLKILTSLQSGEVGLNSINLLFLKLTLASSQYCKISKSISFYKRTFPDYNVYHLKNMLSKNIRINMFIYTIVNFEKTYNFYYQKICSISCWLPSCVGWLIPWKTHPLVPPLGLSNGTLHSSWKMKKSVFI